MKVEVKDTTMKRHSNEIDGKLYYISNLEEYGINFPIQLYIPNNLSDKPDIVLASRTPRQANDLTFDEAIEKCQSSGPNPIGRYLTHDLGNICLMPVLPRVMGVEAPYLGYKIYNNMFDEAYYDPEQTKPISKFRKEDIEKFRDLHIQVANMIKFAKDYLYNKFNLEVDEKVIATGFSAAAKFSIFFTALHPELVKCVIAGGTGGNNIIPDPSLGLTYPLGVSDIPDFNFEEFANIPQYYFIGDNDYNDLTTFLANCEVLEEKDGKVIYARDISGNRIPRRKDGIKSYHDEYRGDEIVHVPDPIPFDQIDFVLDEDGNHKLAYEGGYYTLEQVEYIVENLGNNTQDRFDKLSEIYEYYGINSTYKKYEGDHSTIFNNDKLYEDIDKFVKTNLYNSIKL